MNPVKKGDADILGHIVAIWDRWPNQHPDQAVKAMREIGALLGKVGIANGSGSLTKRGYVLASFADDPESEGAS